MTATDRLLTNNATFAAGFAGRPEPTAAGPSVAVVACMDARMDVYALLGLREGEAHVIRNAGGIVTDDEIRSVAISQRLLGTREVVLIHHTDCGMTKFADDELVAQLRAETGAAPDWAPGAFSDVDEAVRRARRRILDSPFIPHTDSVRGFVYDVATGALREVD